MAKINLRESLGRLDLLTDNKYDLRNTYDSSNISNDKKKKLAESLNNSASAKQIYNILNEDTVKQNGKWVNKGSEGTHGKFKTKKAADAQRKAMFANGYKSESLKEELVDVSDYERVHDESRGGKVYALYRKIENGRGVWAADEISSKTFEPEGRPFRITYRQAIGDEPINNSEKLGMRLGKMLLPKNESLEESVEDDYMKQADTDARKVKSLYRKNKDIDSAFSSLGYTDNGDGSYEKEVEDNVFIVFEYDEDSERLEYKVVNEETRTGTPSNVLSLSKKLKERVQRVSASKYNSPIKEFDWDSDGNGRYYVIYHPKDGKGGCDADVYSDWRQKGRYVLDRIDGNSVGKGKLTKAEVQNLIRQYCSNGELDEDWEPDEWEETDFLDNDGKKVYINIIKEAEDIDDLKDIAHDLYWHDKGLFAMLRNFPKDKPFEWIQNRMIEVIESTMNESLTEASYGGAYDIEDDMFWTKDDLIEFSDAVCEKLADKFGYQYDIADVGAESNNDMYITIMDTTHDIEADVSFRIKMSRIRSPRDLMKYLDTVVYQFVKKFEEEYQYYDFDESLNEDVDDEEIDLDVETDFGDGSVEEGDTFIEDGREWSWIERIAGPIHLDFDNWSVWSARDWDYIQEQIKPILLNKEELTAEKLTKIYDEAEVAYFVVDEDTGFVDWGPVETQTEAQDFLNGKVEDWENDDEYDESLQESKQLKESSDITDNGYSYTLHYEDIGDGKEYDYEVSSDEMFDFLNVISWENGDGPEDIDREDQEQWDNWVADNIDELIKKYKDDILDNFRKDASQEEYDNRDSDDR